MNLVLTNNLGDPVPVMSTDEGGWAFPLESNEPTTLPHVNSSVVIIGDKPSVTEQIQQGIATIGTLVRALITASQARRLRAPSMDNLSVTIDNNGEKAIRVLLGDGTHEWDVQPGETYEADAKGYIELRELGDVAVDPNQHEAP